MSKGITMDYDQREGIESRAAHLYSGSALRDVTNLLAENCHLMQRLEELERDHERAKICLQDACSELVVLRSFLQPRESVMFECAHGLIHDARKLLGERFPGR